MLPAAALGPDNPLAPLDSPQPPHQVVNLDRLPADLVEGIGYGVLPGPAPCPVQDGYDRVRSSTAVAALVLDNGLLRATVLPGLGGRLYSLRHHRAGELLFANPVLQPANLALRGAWFAGGVEWNLGSTGHTTLTCAPMHAARLTAPDGSPLLRLWEWERTRNLPYQVDLWLPPGSEFLFVGVRIRNPHEHQVPAYWWSNAAVPQRAHTRVLVPAEQAWYYGSDRRLDLVPVPGPTASYPARHRDAADLFYEPVPGRRRWIAAVDGSGQGLVQVSTARLLGRKLFVWGQAAGGRRWQHWLAPAGGDQATGGYLEIQAGLARTQLEHLRLPAGAAWDWLEAYGPLSVDPAAAHGDWASAVAAGARAVDAALPDAALRDRFAAWRAVADTEPRDRLHRGSGWGALELARMGRDRAVPGIPFGAADLGEPQRPWLELLAGHSPSPDPGAPPGVALVAPPWRRLLEQAEPTWWIWYHRGVARWYAGRPEDAAEAWRRSIELAPSPWGLRDLGWSHAAAGRTDEAAEAYSSAVRLAPGLRQLVVEAGDALLAAGRIEPAIRLVATARAQRIRHGRLDLLDARSRLAAGDPASARRVFQAGFEVADLREGEHTLTDTWRAVQRALGTDEPLPARYDFRMRAAD